ncbi:MAG: carboxypeptidase-like regulatory domain-containing protein [Panacibacter sp.]
MKRIHFALLFCLFSIFSFNCQKELSSANLGTGNTENNLPAPVTTTLQGNIYDENNQPAPGVQIKVGTKTSITNANGYFRIVDAALDKNASLVSAEKPGYFKAYRTFSATSGVNQVVINLLKKSLTGTVDATAGGDISLSNGSKISLPANGIIKQSDGLPYTGSVDVYAGYIDPTATNINEIIPGSFMANDKNNNRVSLASFGMLAVELQSASGEKLQIAKDNTAKLTISIPSAIQSSAPSTISLWYIDDNTGLWKEEGTATKVGTSYIGEVKHFSFWNADFSNPSVAVTLKVKNSKGLPLAYIGVQIKSPNGGHGYGMTDSLGQVSGLVPASEKLVLEVLDQCGGAVYSQNIGPFSQNTNLGSITIGNTSSSIVTVEGKILDCNNAPIASGYAVISFNNIIRYASVNPGGDFSSTFVTCSSLASTCDILGVDSTSQQQGNVVTTTIISPVTYAGNILACGTSSLEFVDYNIDGTDYNFSLPGDSIIAFTNVAAATLFTTYIRAGQQSSFINFDYSHDKTTGAFPLNNLSTNAFPNSLLTQPFNINVTSYPQNIGEFYAGNFSGKFTDALNPLVVHNITCTFRLRKYY